MANWKSELYSIDSVLNFYEQHESSMFRIYAGNKPELAYCRFEYYEDNKERGAEILFENLQALKQNSQNTNQYLLQVISTLKETAKGVKPSQFYNVTFQLNGNETMQPMAIAGTNDSSFLMNKLIESNEKNNQLLMQLLAEKNEVQEEPEEDNFINGFLKSEQMQNILINGLERLLWPKKGGLSGVNEAANDTVQSNDVELMAAIERLKKVDLQLSRNLNKLADIAENDKPTFNYLISMLQKM